MLLILNKEMQDVKIVQPFEESGLSTKGVSEKTERETKKQMSGFLSILLGS